MKNIAVITQGESDVSKLISEISGVNVQYIKPTEVLNYNLDYYNTICIMGGLDKTPLVLGAQERIKIEEQMAKGKKLLCEYCQSISRVYSSEPDSTRFKRLIYLEKDYENIYQNDILDDQCNDFISTYAVPKTSKPILCYKKYISFHSKAEISEEEKKDFLNWALWLLNDNTMVCNFRMCNFIKARFAPVKKWQSLIKFILSWIADAEIYDVQFGKGYHLANCDKNDFEDKLEVCVKNAVKWFENADILLANGKKGALEGLATEIYPDGTQRTATPVRTDCAGEISMAYLADYMYARNPVSLEKSDNLEGFCFNSMQIKDGIFKGMIRWTVVAWEVCYQDDVARAIIPSLLKVLYLGRNGYLDQCVDALDFLVKTTGTDGTRTARTDNLNLDENSLKELGTKPADFPCAHYNAFYFAALLLCYKLTGIEKFKEAGTYGLQAIMKVYPNTIREQSETQEMCRLILPLSWLYWVTQEPTHKEWLYRVTNDLQKIKHKSGGYTEWDTGYTATCNKKDGSPENCECSLLSNNGDPVIDLLYSVNWLPMGFIQAYLVTKDEWFKDLWEDIAVFMIKSQIISDNPKINGAWARGFDVDLMEAYGIPHDVGWGPWAIESGWTVAEITSGMILGIISDELKKFYL